jgi:cell division inhibitor SepF
MPGAMHRMGVYLGLVEEEDDYADGSDGFGPPLERMPSRRSEEYHEPRLAREPHHVRGAEVSHPVSREYREYVEEDGSANGNGYGYAEHQPAYQITALHPRTYNEARTIGESFRRNTPVIMNLTEMDDADAKRLVDFAAGLTFGLHGRIERVTAKVFLLSPHNVSVTAQDKARIESGFFNQS